MYCYVQPKREALAAANAALEESQSKLRDIQRELDKLNAKLKELTDEVHEHMTI